MGNLKIWAARAVRAVLFLFVLAAVVLALDNSLKLIQEDNLCARYYRYPDNTFDVTFLGASLVLYGIFPMELYSEYGISGYSLSTGNQSLKASYYLAKESIEKDHPKLIVLDCGRAWEDEEDMEPQYIHYITDTMPYLSKNRLTMIRDLSKEGADIKPVLFPLIAYHSRWQTVDYEDAAPQTKEMVYGAKVISRITGTTPFDEPKITEHAMSETSRKYLQKTIDLCRENDTGLLLLAMPVPGKNKFIDQHGYNLRCSAVLEVEQLAKENGVRFVNYLAMTQELGFDLEKDSSDGEHLNRWGAAKFTKILGSYIKENYDIPDRRGQGGVYEEIEEDLARYPVNRMKDSLNRSRDLREYAATLQSDAAQEPVEEALILISLNGPVDEEILTEEAAAKLRSFGLSTNLHEWKGHGWLAVIDGGRVIYETGTAGDSGTASESFLDAPDSYAGKAGRLTYEVKSGRIDEATGDVHTLCSIRVNGLEYTTESRGIQFAVFDKTTGKLMDQCCLNIHNNALDCTHDNH
ncbi:MAG: hypothetical protein Q4D81_00740 [Eubacteriales bacterium]|nr:hypothetical protein [Eubacteriales bacterium]